MDFIIEESVMNSSANELQTFINHIFKTLKKSSSKAVIQGSSVMRSALSTASPVDKGRYQLSWKTKINSPKADRIASANVYNETPYGDTLELGSIPGQLPWKSPGEKTVLASVAGSERIYSKQAVGGIAGPIFTDARGQFIIDKMASDIIESI